MSKKIDPRLILEAALNPSDIPIIDPAGMEEHRRKEELGQKAAQIQEVTIIARDIIKYNDVTPSVALERAKDFVALMSEFVTTEIDKLKAEEEKSNIVTDLN